MNLDVGTFIKKYKGIATGVVVLMVAVGGYLLLSGGEGSTEFIDPTLTYDEFGLPSQTSAVGQEILSVLNDLRSLQIDESVFESAVFRSLVDYTVATTTEPLGRPDPFSPLPFESEEDDG